MNKKQLENEMDEISILLQNLDSLNHHLECIGARDNYAIVNTINYLEKRYSIAQYEYTQINQKNAWKSKNNMIK